MDWLTFFANIISSLSWPLTIVIIILILKGPIIKILPHLKYLKYKDFQLEFEKGIEEVQNLVNKADLPDVPTPSESPKATNSDEITGTVTVVAPNPSDLAIYLNDLAKENPRASIIESWLLLEKSLRKFANKKNLFYPSKSTTMDILKMLVANQFLTSEINEIITQLRVLRNKSVHDVDLVLHPQQAKEYIELALRVIATISVE